MPSPGGRGHGGPHGGPHGCRGGPHGGFGGATMGHRPPPMGGGFSGWRHRTRHPMGCYGCIGPMVVAVVGVIATLLFCVTAIPLYVNNYLINNG